MTTPTPTQPYFKAKSYRLPTNGADEWKIQQADRVLRDPATDIEELQTCRDGWQVANRELTLDFIRNNRNLKKLWVVIFAEEAFPQEDLDFVVNIFKAANRNESVQDVRLNLGITPNTLEQACMLLATRCPAFRGLSIIFDPDHVVGLEYQRLPMRRHIVHLARVISNQRSLKRLHFNSISDSLLSTLMGSFTRVGTKYWDELEVFGLSNPQDRLSFDELETFCGSCWNLQKLELEPCMEWDKANAQALVRALKAGPSITGLALWDMTNSEAMQVIADYTATDSRLSELLLFMGIYSDYQSVRQFRQFFLPNLSTNTSVVKLDLSCDFLYEPQASSSVLRDVLIRNTCLESLRLCSRFDTLHTLNSETLSEGFGSNTTLKRLDFCVMGHGHSFDFDSFSKAFAAAGDNCGIEELRIVGFLAPTGDKALSTFIGSLPKKLKILVLDLDGPLLEDDQVLGDLLEGIQKTMTLKKIAMASRLWRTKAFVQQLSVALPKIKGLTHLETRLNPEQLSGEDRTSLQAKLLKGLQLNQSLHCVDVNWLGYFEDSFHDSLQRYGIRNKVNSAAKTIINDGLPQPTLPHVLKMIEKTCRTTTQQQQQQQPTLADLQPGYFARVLHPFLMRNPASLAMDGIKKEYLDGGGGKPEPSSSASSEAARKRSYDLLNEEEDVTL